MKNFGSYYMKPNSLNKHYYINNILQSNHLFFVNKQKFIMITLSINRVIYNGVIYSLFAYTKLSIIGDSCGHQIL